MQLFVISEHERLGALVFGLAELQTGYGCDVVAAECARVIELAAGGPVVAGAFVGLEETARAGCHIIDFAVFHVGKCVAQRA